MLMIHKLLRQSVVLLIRRGLDIRAFAYIITTNFTTEGDSERSSIALVVGVSNMESYNDTTIHTKNTTHLGFPTPRKF